MGNATKVALVALLILLVVVIAKLVREDSEEPVSNARRTSQDTSEGLVAKTEAGTNTSGRGTNTSGRGTNTSGRGTNTSGKGVKGVAKVTPSKRPGASRTGASRTGAPSRTPGGGLALGTESRTRRPAESSGTRTGVATRQSLNPPSEQPSNGHTGASGSRNSSALRTGTGAAGPVGPPRLGGTQTTGKYQPQLPALGETALPAARPRVADRGSVRMLPGVKSRRPSRLGGGSTNSSSASSKEPALVSTVNSAFVEEKKDRSSSRAGNSTKASGEKTPGAKTPGAKSDDAPQSVRKKDADARSRKLAKQYEAMRLRGGMPGDALASGPKPGSSLTASGLGAPAPRKGSLLPEGAGRTYVIRQNDSLWGIAAQYYGDGTLWPFLEKANPGVKVRPGNKLVVPPRPSAASQRTTRNIGSKAGRSGTGRSGTGSAQKPVPGTVIERAGGHRVYLVQRGDTLSGIAKKFYGDGLKYPVLEQANQGIRPKLLKAGAKIRVPILEK